jgi:tRNA-Thr(GGU) m(6)t(6)A37 methyltransferase TsaA
METTSCTLAPIGRVHARDGEYCLRLDPSFGPALAELEGFSHLVVLWWCHHLDREDHRQRLELPRPYRRAPETIGVFATRSPARPNPIALTPVPLLAVDRDAATLRIAYIDAEDDSPVLDIKPYQPCLDRIRDVSVPAWCRHWPAWYEDSAAFDWTSEMVCPS